MESKPVLWDKDCEVVVPPLRQPNIKSNTLTNESNKRQMAVETDSKILGNNGDFTRKLDTSIRTLSEVQINTSNRKSTNLEDIIANSTLKPDAPEWFPSSTTNICDNLPTSNVGFGTVNRVQDRLKVHKINNELNPQTTRSSEKTNSSNSSADHEVDQNSIADSTDITRLRQIIKTLTKDPGQFDNLLELFLETLLPYIDDITALSEIAQLLVEQAINNANFRYTGARLCWYVEQSSPEFRAELHLKCIKQLAENSNKQNVLLFIAELYTNLPHMNVYGTLLIDSFKQLLARGTSEDIKCICQALKLTGHSLEQSNKTSLDEVFSELKSFAKNKANESTSALINSVINLRNANWGYSSETSNSTDSEADPIFYEELQNTVFYHTDGHTFTNEENEFLVAHMDSNGDYLSDTSDPDELCDPEPEMDEEIQAAFKEFLKYSRH